MEFEEPFQAFIRKIKSLGPNFIKEEEDARRFHKALNAAFSTTKKQEEGVMTRIVESIKTLDEKISSYKYFASKEEVECELHDVIRTCLDQLEKHAKEHKYTLKMQSEEEKTEEHKSWVVGAKKDVEKEHVTDPFIGYNNLEPILQQCLLSLVVFSKEVVIKKRYIIYLWIGEGLVKPTSTRTAEQVGEEYFKMLLSSGLVLPIKKKHDKIARGCILHQEVWQMLKSKAEVIGLFRYYSEKDSSRGNECPLSNFSGTRSKEHRVVTFLEKKTNQVLTLFNSSAEYLYCERSKFSRLKSIKVLQLGKWESLAHYSIEIANEKFLRSLQVMQKLTYLGLEGISGITSLDLKPLTNLLILNLRACPLLENLFDLALVTKLTHLDISECPLIKKMPRGLLHLSELQVLKGFKIGRDKQPHSHHHSCRLEELVVLKKLRKLSTNVASRVDANAHLAALKKFRSLHSLTITWGRGTEKELSWSSTSIEKLDIRRIPHETLLNVTPHQFPNLKKLYISGGMVTKVDLGRQQWRVETLRLKFLSKLKCDEWSQLVETFPHLACIEIRECPKLNKKFLRHLGEDGVWKKDKKGVEDHHQLSIEEEGMCETAPSCSAM